MKNQTQILSYNSENEEATKAALSEYQSMKNDKMAYPRYFSFSEIIEEVAEDADDYKVK